MTKGQTPFINKTNYIIVKIKGGIEGATTFSITTLSITTFSIKTLGVMGLFATLIIMTFSINDTQHNSTLSIMLNATFYLLLC